MASSSVCVSLIFSVQLWTTGNYHWYLKQELRLPLAKDGSNGSSSVGLAGMVWDPILPLTLHMLTSGELCTRDRSGSGKVD